MSPLTPPNCGHSSGHRFAPLWAKNRLMRCSKQAYSITWSACSNMEVGNRSNVEGSASGAPQRCSWDNSPRPGAGEKLSLLPAKVVEVDPCQTSDKLDVPRFSTLPGGKHTASVSHLPASGGDCGTSSLR